jgi:hypothetical protein
MRINEGQLARWQNLDAVVVLAVVADHAKRDDSYRPRKDEGSSRWHVSAGGHDYELLVTGPRFWDTRARRGGGGALDLVMHLLGVDFKGATRQLRDLQL